MVDFRQIWLAKKKKTIRTVWEANKKQTKHKRKKGNHGLNVYMCRPRSLALLCLWVLLGLGFRMFAGAYLSFFWVRKRKKPLFFAVFTQVTTKREKGSDDKGQPKQTKKEYQNTSVFVWQGFDTKRDQKTATKYIDIHLRAILERKRPFFSIISLGNLFLPIISFFFSVCNVRRLFKCFDTIFTLV